MLIAGLTPEKNKSDCKKICPSVIEITLVGTYAEISLACVSMIGNAVIEPPPKSSFSLVIFLIIYYVGRIRHLDTLSRPGGLRNNNDNSR